MMEASSPVWKAINTRLRRRRLLAAAAAATATTLAACNSQRQSSSSGGGGSSAAGSSTIDPSKEASLTPQRGGVIQYLGYRQLEHLNPYSVVGANVAYYLSGGVYDCLVHWEYKPFQDWRSTYKLIGSLAESWETPNNTTYVFHMRKGVTWHDGQPFTAEDVAFSFAFLADPANKFSGATNLRPVESLTAPDQYTVQIKTKTPQAPFLSTLQTQALILPKHAHDRGDQFEKVAIGTGPFKVQSYDAQKGITYVANESYWRQGLPYIDTWKIGAPTDEAGRLASFTADQNDVLHLTDKRQVAATLPLVKGARSFTFIRDVTGDMYLKMDKQPFNDKRVRQAFHNAIDRPDMQKTLNATDGLINPPGINALATGWVIPPAELNTMPGWRTPKDKDLQDAKQLLESAGYTSSNPLTFTIAMDQAVDYTSQEATVLASQLKKLGVTINIQPKESGVYTKDFTSGNYQAVIDATGGSRTEDSAWLARFHSGGFFNSMPVKDPNLDSMIEAEMQEFDETKRKAICIDIERRLAADVDVIPLLAFPGYFVGQPYVHGWTDLFALNTNDVDWGQTWFDQPLAPRGRSQA